MQSHARVPGRHVGDSVWQLHRRGVAATSTPSKTVRKRQAKECLANVGRHSFCFISLKAVKLCYYSVLCIVCCFLLQQLQEGLDFVFLYHRMLPGKHCRRCLKAKMTHLQPMTPAAAVVRCVA